MRFSRENVYTRDGGRCQYCGHAVTRGQATYDHVVPRSQGGTTSWGNVVIACLPCNQRKGGRTPAQVGLRLRATPRRPRDLTTSFRLTWAYEPGMPVSWRAWLRDVSYWHVELEHEE